MIKAYPRVWVDLTTVEVMSVIFQIFNPSKARSRSLLPEFEKSYAEFIGTKEAVSFSNCRSALYFSLEALNFKKGDEIIIPAFTFWAEAAVVVLAGLKPVFVDVEFETMNIDASRIEEAITPRTRGILFPHLNGLSADMDKIMDIANRNKLRVIEDCARTCGGSYKDKRVGSFDIGAFSFGYGKSFYGFGGGMITSNDETFINRLRELKSDFKNISVKGLYKKTLKGCLLKFLSMPLLNGFTLFPLAYRYQTKGAELFSSWFRIKKPNYTTVPEDFRTDMYDVQGRMGFRQIRTIDTTNQRRKENLKLLNKELSGIPGLHIPPDPSDREHVCVHYAVWTERKKELQKFLMQNNIDAQDESSEDVTQMRRYSSYIKNEFKNARRLHDRIIYLPSHPCLTEKDILYIADKVKEFFKT